SPPGTSLAETDRLLRHVESVLQETPEVQTYSRRTGLQLGGGVTEANTGDFFVRLKPFPRRGIEEVMDDVRDEIEKHIPGLQVDRVKAGLEGMDPEAVTKALSDFLTGNVTTHVQQGPKLIGVRVWIPRDARDTMRNIENLLLRAPDGHLFPLKRVATLIPLSGQPEIMRDDLKRMVAVTARIS